MLYKFTFRDVKITFHTDADLLIIFDAMLGSSRWGNQRNHMMEVASHNGFDRIHYYHCLQHNFAVHAVGHRDKA